MIVNAWLCRVGHTALFDERGPAAMADQEIRSPEKERQILDGAAAAFAQDGYEGASMSHIAAMAGVSKGTLYNYFAGKKDLFAAFVHRECTQRLMLLFEEVEAGASTEATLLRICRRLVDMMVSDSGLLIYRMVVAEARKFPELAEAFYDAGPRRAQHRMAELIDRQTASGQLTVPDSVFAAEQLFALMQARVVVKLRMGLADGFPEEELDRVVREGVRLFLRGYGPACGG
jgi:AcrR family transcriptional regulator